MFLWLSWQRKLLQESETSCCDGSRSRSPHFIYHQAQWDELSAGLRLWLFQKVMLTESNGEGWPEGVDCKPILWELLLQQQDKMLESVEDILRVCIYWVILFSLMFRRSEPTVDLRTEATLQKEEATRVKGLMDQSFSQGTNNRRLWQEKRLSFLHIFQSTISG